MTWSERRLQDTLSQLRAFGDDTTLVECKKAAGGLPQRIGETICAFANMPQPGVIILGVDERQDFKVTGVANPAQMEKSLANLSRSAVDPAPQLTFTHLKLHGNAVVVVDVTPLLPQEKPATYQSRPYLRQADGDYIMNSNDLRMLELSALTESQQPHFDFQSLPHTDVSLLDQKVLNAFTALARTERTRLAQVEDDHRLLQITNVIDADGNVRLAGLYAMGFLPQSTEPALGATAAVRLSRGEGAGRNQNLTEIEGPIPLMLDDAMGWIKRNTNTTSRYNHNGHLVDVPEFPPSAIREVLANALVHRDLGPSLDVGKKIEIRITDRALVVQNPGGLRGLSVEQLESAALAKAAVNKRLYEIARYLRTPDGERVIEGEGGGIQEILASLREARLPKPRFVDNGVEFKVIFPRGSRFTEDEDAWLAELRDSDLVLDPTEEDLLVNLRNHGAATLSSIGREYAPLSEARCERMLGRLVDAGVVQKKGVFFELAGHGDGDTSVAPPPATWPTASAERSVPDELATLGKNVPAVHQAIASADNPSSGAPLREILEKTGLTAGQVRYALAPLIREGIVLMEGGQGSRDTTYQLGNPAN